MLATAFYKLSDHFWSWGKYLLLVAVVCFALALYGGAAGWFGPDYEEDWMIAMGEAQACMTLHDAPGALSALNHALDLSIQHFPVGDTRVSSTIDALSLYFVGQGDLRSARSTMRKGLQTWLKTGASDKQTLHAMNRLAELEWRLGNLAEAQMLHRQLFRIYSEAGDSAQPEVIDLLIRMGELHSDADAWDEAEKKLRQAAGLASKHVTLGVRATLGLIRLCRLTGRTLEGDQLLAGVVSRLRGVQLDPSVATQVEQTIAQSAIERSLVGSAVSPQELTEAVAILDASSKLSSEALGPEHFETLTRKSWTLRGQYALAPSPQIAKELFRIASKLESQLGDRAPAVRNTRRLLKGISPQLGPGTKP